jgi:hypothetical protein
MKLADALESAASEIEATKQHPGQVVPGVWKVGGANSPERVIGIVVTSALAKVARRRLLDMDTLLSGYLEVSRNISLTPKGGPDVMAAQHLRDAAAELRRVGRGVSRQAV